MKPQTEPDTETSPATGTVHQPEILNETEQFIEKLEAVERDRKESEVSEAEEAGEAGKEAETQSVVAAVEIIVRRPSEQAETTEEVGQVEAGQEEALKEEVGHEDDVFEIVDHNTVDNEEAVEAVEAPDEDSISIFAGVGADSTVIEGGEVASEFTLYRRDDDIKGNYHVVEKGVIVSKRNEDNISVLSFSVNEDGENVSLRSVTIEKDVKKDDVEEEEDDEDDDKDSVKTLTEGKEEKRARVDVTEGVVYTNGDVTDDIEIHPDDQDDEVEVDQFRTEEKPSGDRVSVRSYSVHGDYILSLHQRVETSASPRPSPRSLASSATTSSDDQQTTETDGFREPAVTEETVDMEQNLSYEESRSRMNFEAIVKASMEEHKAERNKTNVEVLEDIEREEGEDTPNIAMLLAWAKSTKKNNTTQTFVVKKQKREQVLRQSVNVNDENFKVIIQEKVSEQVEQEKSGGDRPAFMVKKKRDVATSPSQLVSKVWLENAINHHEGVNNSSVTKMEFAEVKMGLHRASIEAQVNGESKTYNWSIKAKGDPGDKESFVTEDLAPRLAG